LTTYTHTQRQTNTSVTDTISSTGCKSAVELKILIYSTIKTKDTEVLRNRELNQACSMPDAVDRPIMAHNTVA